MKPVFEVVPKVGECELAGGQVGRCVMFWGPDWQQVRLYYLGLERELRAACLALGGTREECGTD